MKKTLILLSIFLIVLTGCNKEKTVVSNESTANEQDTSTEVHSDLKTAQNIFNSEDIEKAVDITNTYIGMLNELDGKVFKTYEESRLARDELSDRIKTKGFLHEESSVRPLENTTYVDREAKLHLSADNFKVHGDQAEEKYYPYIDAHSLTIPVDFVTLNGVSLSQSFLFVKTSNNEVKLLDAMNISGERLDKKDEEAYYDSYNQTKLQEEIKDMDIQ